MSEYIVDGAEPNSTVLKSTTPNGYEHEKWLPVREEIVRCRDCKHYTYADKEHGNDDWCGKHEHIAWSVNGFCAWGERRTDDN